MNYVLVTPDIDCIGLTLQGDLRNPHAFLWPKISSSRNTMSGGSQERLSVYINCNLECKSMEG